MTKGFCGGEILVDNVIKPMLYTYPYIKCFIKLVTVWLPDPANSNAGGRVAVCGIPDFQLIL